MSKYDVVIIGGGLGGLECGYTLAKNGLSVCILEKNPVLGGCLQTFKRRGVTFDTGFHYIGGLSEGQPLHRIFNYFNLLDLPWHKLDEEAFDDITINGETFHFANGHEQFAETLAEKFPNCADELKKYTAFLKNVGDNIFSSFEPRDHKEFFAESLFARSAYDFLNETISDSKLRDVLSGASLKMELNAEKLPLYTFAQINNSFIESAWRIKGGGHQISDSLAKSIEAFGGTIRTKANVTRLIEKDGLISAVEINGDEVIETKHVISNIHPANTMELVTESQALRKIYRNRINRLPNTYGMFTANISLKEDCVPYKNKNLYIYQKGRLWDISKYTTGQKAQCVLVSYQVPEDGKQFTRNIDLLTPMFWEEVEQWTESTVGRRGEAYEEFKKQKAEECIEIASKHIPELRGAIEHVYTSTPLSYRDYTGTKEGSAYGVQKDYSQLMTTLLSPKTPIQNLFLTGQSLNLHGILGVSMTSFFTCAEIIGMDKVALFLKE